MNFSVERFRITGLSPVLQHNPAAMAAPAAPALGRKKIPTPTDEAEAGTYRLASGQLYLPSIMFRSAILGAATGKRVGKMAAKGIVAGAVLPNDEHCALIDPATSEPISEFAVFTTRAVVQGKGIMRSRPRIESWACTLALQVDLDAIDTGVVLELLREAGARIGVGDWRPAKGGIYGRFNPEKV